MRIAACFHPLRPHCLHYLKLSWQKVNSLTNLIDTSANLSHSAKTASTLTEILGRIVPTPSNKGPSRPRPSPDLLEFFPHAKYVTRMDWDDMRVQELNNANADVERAKSNTERAKVNTERALALARDEVVSLGAILCEKDQGMGRLRERHAANLQSMELKNKEQLKEFEEKLAAIAKRKEEAQASAPRPKRTRTPNSPDNELSDAIEEINTTIAKAIQEMRTMAAEKNRPEQAVARWEKKHCFPSLQMVQLTDRVNQIRERHNKRTKEVEQLEKEVTAREAQHRREKHELEAHQEAFTKEQTEWFHQRSQKLDGAELEAVKKAWLDIQEKKLTPQLEKKDKVDSYLAAKAHLEQKYRIERIKANEEGKKDGLRTGRREGRADSLKELNEKMARAKQEGRAEAQI
jgi:hypothetical protein